MKQYVFEMKVYHRSGVLSKVASLFSRRGCNIQCLEVYAEPDGRLASMRIVVREQPETVRQIHLQMDKLEDVMSATLHQETEAACGA